MIIRLPPMVIVPNPVLSIFMARSLVAMAISTTLEALTGRLDIPQNDHHGT